MKNLKSFLLIISLIFLFFNFSYANLYIVKDQEGNNICMTNQETLISKYKALGYTVSIIQGIISSSESPESQTTPEPKPELQPDPEKEKLKQEAEAQIKARIKELENQPKADIVFVDSTNRLDGNYYYVEGILKNKGKGTAYYVKIEIRSLDKYGKLVSIDYGYAESKILAPNRETTYQIMVENNSKIETFDKTVSWENI